MIPWDKRERERESGGGEHCLPFSVWLGGWRRGRLGWWRCRTGLIRRSVQTTRPHLSYPAWTHSKSAFGFCWANKTRMTLNGHCFIIMGFTRVSPPRFQTEVHSDAASSCSLPSAWSALWWYETQPLGPPLRHRHSTSHTYTMVPYISHTPSLRSMEVFKCII